MDRNYWGTALVVGLTILLFAVLATWERRKRRDRFAKMRQDVSDRAHQEQVDIVNARESLRASAQQCDWHRARAPLRRA